MVYIKTNIFLQSTAIFPMLFPIYLQSPRKNPTFHTLLYNKTKKEATLRLPPSIIVSEQTLTSGSMLRELLRGVR